MMSLCEQQGAEPIGVGIAVEKGFQPGGKKLREAGVRTILFVNKLDNPDYSLDETLINIEEVLGVRPVLMTLPEYRDGKMTGVLDVLSKSRLEHSATGEEVVDEGWNVDDGWDQAHDLKKHYAEAVEFASNFDDEILKLAMEGKPVPAKILLRGLKALAASDDYALCYAGSAMEGFGVRSLTTALTFFLPEVPAFDKGELGQVIRLRYFKGVGEISIFRSHTDLERKAWPAGFEFSRLKANLLVPVDEIRAGDIYAMRTPFETELGEILKVTPEGRSDPIPQSDQGERPHASLRDKYQPLLQTRVECLGSEDFLHVDKSLNMLGRMDPSFRVQKDDGGFWYLHTVGEVQLDVLLSRLKREFGCEVKAGSPEVRWQERLCREVGPVENSFQLGPHKISIRLSATPLEGDAHDIRLSAEFLETAPREILAGVRSALLESAEVGILGKGALVGVRFEVHEFTWTEGALPPMIKKACADAVTKLIKPADVELYEPIMELSLECPVNFAGLVTGDIQSRDGKVKEIGGDGKTHFLKAEVPLRKIFGYATGVRSISKGTALYSMKLLGYKQIGKA